MPTIIRLGNNLYVARFETMKIYSALIAVEKLLEKGLVQQGDTLLDSSSGLYAYALALACHKFGMRCHIIASKTVGKTLMTQLQILGAKVEQLQVAATLKLDQSQRMIRIQQILQENPRIHWMQQYHDDIHYQGYHPIAEHIGKEVGLESLSLVGGVGSGCSTAGLIEVLRSDHHAIELIGVQPFGSMTFHSQHIEDPGIIIAGIGSAIYFKNVVHTHYDRIHWVSFSYGMSACIALLRQHAIFAGLSTGCNYLVAKQEAACQPQRNFIFIAADTGHRYIDSVFAQHEQAQDIDTLFPRKIHSIEAMSMPWSMLDWSRKKLSSHVASCTHELTTTHVGTQ